MWKCADCGEQNQDQYNSCGKCGKPRGGGVFSVPAPMANFANGNYTRPASIDIREFPQDDHVPFKGKLGRFANVLGLILMFLLPAVILFGFIYAHLSAQSQGPFAELAKLCLQDRQWTGYLFYYGTCLLCILLSILPGLWTSLIARR